MSLEKWPMQGTQFGLALETKKVVISKIRRLSCKALCAKPRFDCEAHHSVGLLINFDFRCFFNVHPMYTGVLALIL